MPTTITRPPEASYANPGLDWLARSSTVRRCGRASSPHEKLKPKLVATTDLGLPAFGEGKVLSYHCATVDECLSGRSALSPCRPILTRRSRLPRRLPG
jgi:hypothetical protein